MNDKLEALVAKFPVPAQKDGKLAEVDKAATDAALVERARDVTGARPGRAGTDGELQGLLGLGGEGSEPAYDGLDRAGADRVEELAAHPPCEGPGPAQRHSRRLAGPATRTGLAAGQAARPNSQCHGSGFDPPAWAQAGNRQPSPVRRIDYEPHRRVCEQVHPALRYTEEAVIRGQAVYKALAPTRAKGWRPDVMLAHSGFGDGLFLKLVVQAGSPSAVRPETVRAAAEAVLAACHAARLRLAWPGIEAPAAVAPVPGKRRFHFKVD